MNGSRASFKKLFRYYGFFHKYLGYKIVFALLISIVATILDGFGLTMFLPLLQSFESGTVNPDDLGNLSFLISFIGWFGLDVSVQSVLIVMIALFCAKGILKYFEITYRVGLRYMFTKLLRFQQIDLLAGLKYEYFVRSDAGRIQNTLSAEIGKVVSAFADYLLSLQNMVILIVYFFLALMANAELALLVGIGGVLTNFLFLPFYRKSKELSRKHTAISHKFQSLLIQQVALFKYLKAIGRASFYGEKVKGRVDELEETSKKIGKLGSLLESGREPLVMLVIVGVIFLEVKFLGRGLASFMLSLLFLYRGMGYLMLLQTQWNSFLGSTGALENVSAFINELGEYQENFEKGSMPPLKEGIEVKAVDFGYENTILHNINLKIAIRQTVAIVGESGSGKTTLVNLICGLIPPGKGEILIDGKNLHDCDVRTYQKQIGYITQEPMMFSDSIFNNVTLWDEKSPANVERFWRALKRAAIDDFVGSLSEKEDSPLGSRGVLVSGGQKQRLAIAREFYKDVEVMILDEATAALDSENELIVQQSMEELKGKATFIMVAHRLATVRIADMIVLLKDGRVERMGSYDELMQQSESFRKMVQLQEL
ncbi:MAG: ABC transporter ATP-binding protein [Cryomorphaceae bacterium]|nr:MAG: ABC transporter ATP-binding protein [Cryomorphaceae bacterium]